MAKVEERKGDKRRNVFYIETNYIRYNSKFLNPKFTRAMKFMVRPYLHPKAVS